MRVFMSNTMWHVALNPGITEMQDVAYQYRRLPEESLTVSATVLNEFSSAIYDMTSKYAYKKRIIIDGTTVKNV